MVFLFMLLMKINGIITIKGDNMKKEVSCWRKVFQCKKCTLKYKTKHKNCDCGNNTFFEANVYCLDKILSFCAFINCIVGGRRKGKTYSVAEFCVNGWLKEQKKFAWVRRYGTEGEKALDAFGKLGYYTDEQGVFYFMEKEVMEKNGDKEKLTIKKEKIYIGWLVTINRASKIRGGEFNDYHTLVIDEYGDESGTELNDEFKLTNSLIVSIIDEKEDGIVFVLSNNVNRFLPIYNHIQVRWDQEWTYNWKVDAVVHIVMDKDRTWHGASKKWLQSTEYYNYAVHNKPLDYDSQLIESYKLEFLEPICCFKMGYRIKQNLRLIQLKEDEFVLDICENCQHNFLIIDTYNAIEFTQSVNTTFQQQLYSLFFNKQLKYTQPSIKNEIISWVANNLRLLSQ